MSSPLVKGGKRFNPNQRSTGLVTGGAEPVNTTGFGGKSKGRLSVKRGTIFLGSKVKLCKVVILMKAGPELERKA